MNIALKLLSILLFFWMYLWYSRTKKWKSIYREAEKNAKYQTLLISMHTPSVPIPWRFTCCVHTWTRWMLAVLCTTKVDGSILIRHPGSVRNIFLCRFTKISALDATIWFTLTYLLLLVFHLRQHFMITDTKNVHVILQCAWVSHASSRSLHTLAF